MHKDAIKACLVGIQRDRQASPEKQSHVGEKLGSAFEAWVNEALLLISGVGKTTSERMPVMLTDIPADGSFYSKDTSQITSIASRFSNSHTLWGTRQIVQRNSE